MTTTISTGTSTCTSTIRTIQKKESRTAVLTAHSTLQSIPLYFESKEGRKLFCAMKMEKPSLIRQF